MADELRKVTPQFDLRCCYNCKYYFADYDDYNFCEYDGVKPGERREDVSPICICTQFELDTS